ncbi:MAG: hypothetical protein KA143_05850 [Saprospiraceae bacterium]|nr:hypothetical protein [Saprospiraceae bacterium]
MKIFFYTFFLFNSIVSYSAELAVGRDKYVSHADSLPAIFMIGQFTDPFEALNNSSQTLLEICQNDVYLAYDKWLHMLSELESVSESLGLTLKGSKFWFSVFWNQDGTIKHFAYFPKSGSKEMDQKVFKEVLTTFIANYKLPIVNNKSTFYNYGSGAFPLPDRKPTARKQ